MRNLLPINGRGSLLGLHTAHVAPSLHFSHMSWSTPSRKRIPVCPWNVISTLTTVCRVSPWKSPLKLWQWAGNIPAVISHLYVESQSVSVLWFSQESADPQMCTLGLIWQCKSETVQASPERKSRANHVRHLLTACPTAWPSRVPYPIHKQSQGHCATPLELEKRMGWDALTWILQQCPGLTPWSHCCHQRSLHCLSYNDNEWMWSLWCQFCRRNSLK